jgi:hypothetical protein
LVGVVGKRLSHIGELSTPAWANASFLPFAGDLELGLLVLALVVRVLELGADAIDLGGERVDDGVVGGEEGR